MSIFCFGNGNGYSYGVRIKDDEIMEFVTNEEARDYFDEASNKDED